jgi:hypothetical protein
VGEQAAVEIGRAPELAGGGGAAGVHLGEQVAEHVVTALAALAGVEGQGELQVGQQVAVFGKHAQHALQHEPLSFQGGKIATRFAPLAQAGKQLTHAAGLGPVTSIWLRPNTTGWSVLLKNAREDAWLARSATWSRTSGSSTTWLDYTQIWSKLHSSA